jgi:NAD(P)H-hydrate epimerase
MRVLTASEMHDADAAAATRVGEVELMRAAGDALAEALRRLAPGAKKIVAFAGPGNNGGDAFAAFASLGGPSQRIVYALPAPNVSAGRRDAQRRAAAAGVVTRPFPLSDEEAIAALEGADVALDALLGTGGRIALSHEFEPALTALERTHAKVISVDLPTGVDATTGEVGPRAVRAWSTVMLGAPKIGLLLEPARAQCGDLYVGDIGTASEIDSVSGERYATLDAAEFLALLPLRAEDSDKRSSGAPLIVAGSSQFPGAGVLCARAAARAGAGYVTVACPESAAASLRSHLVEQVVVTYDDSSPILAIDDLLDLTRRCTSVAIGPGLGLSDAMGEIVRGFLERLDRPFVADASALFHLGKHLDLLRGKKCVLTPHEGEFARLSGRGTIAPGKRMERLREFVQRTGVTTLLKGNATLIDDGETMHVNVTGTSALATAGTGDVLTGMIGTLLSQGLTPLDAARAAAYWHGLAGRRAARERHVGVMAGDLPDILGGALTDAAPEPAQSLVRRIV